MFCGCRPLGSCLLEPRSLHGRVAVLTLDWLFYIRDEILPQLHGDEIFEALFEDPPKNRPMESQVLNGSSQETTT